MELIKNIYPNENAENLYWVFNTLKLEIKMLKGLSKPTMSKVLFDPEFRTATWVSIFVGAANGLTAINVIGAFILPILQIIEGKGARSVFTP